MMTQNKKDVKTFDFSQITNGTIIRLKNDTNRDWVCIHYSNCDMSYRLRHNKNNKNHTGYYLFGGLWGDGSPLTDEPYGKCIERLEISMANNIEAIVGHISNEKDFSEYRECGRIENKNSTLNTSDVKQHIIDYTNWLAKQDLLISEGVDGHSFRSSMRGGKKYSAEELYDKFISEKSDAEK